MRCRFCRLFCLAVFFLFHVAFLFGFFCFLPSFFGKGILVAHMRINKFHIIIGKHRVAELPPCCPYADK